MTFPSPVIFSTTDGTCRLVIIVMIGWTTRSSVAWFSKTSDERRGRARNVTSSPIVPWADTMTPRDNYTKKNQAGFRSVGVMRREARAMLNRLFRSLRGNCSFMNFLSDRLREPRLLSALPFRLRLVHSNNPLCQLWEWLWHSYLCITAWWVIICRNGHTLLSHFAVVCVCVHFWYLLGTFFNQQRPCQDQKSS